MQRRHFLSFITVFFASHLTQDNTEKSSPKSPVKNTQHQHTFDDDYMVVNNWYLKKQDLKNS